MVCLREGASFADALVVLRGVFAYNFVRLHLDAQPLAHELDCSKDGQVGISLAASWAAHVADALERAGGDEVRKRPGLLRKGRGARCDGHEDACADAGTASAPETAGATRDLLAATLHLQQSGLKIEFAASVAVSREQGGSHHDVMLAAVHVAKRHRHEPIHNLQRVA